MISLFGRAKSRWRLHRRLRLWYHKDYSVSSLAQTSRVMQLVPERAELVIAALSEDSILSASDLYRPHISSFEDICRVHSLAYLEQTTDPEVLGHIFGLSPGFIDIHEMLRAQRLAVGGTVAAAINAIKGHSEISFNLGGGFHHADPDRGGGFCIYNDIAIAIAKLRAMGFAEPIAIVDLDFHQGDGNKVTFAEDRTVLTLSVHGSVWTTIDAVADFGFELTSGTGDVEYMRLLRRTLHHRLSEHRPGLIFYIAGNDVLAGDHLGDFALTAAGVLQRDAYVATVAKQLETPMVVTLGGGYSKLAWHCTANFIRWILTDESRQDPRPEPGLRDHFARIAADLTPSELRTDAMDFKLSEEDILGDLGPRAPSRHILGYYSAHGIELGFERYGLLNKLRDFGFHSLELTVDPSDRFHQVIQVHGRKGQPVSTPPLLLVELVMRKRTLGAPPDHDLPEFLECMSVEWLLMQDPTAPFSLRRPRLPGQSHPGLGLALEAQEMLIIACKRVGLHAMLSIPAHYHNAYVEGLTFMFLEPEKQAELLALMQLLAEWSLPEASWLVDGGGVIFANGQRLQWEPGHHLLSVDDRLSAYFESEAYRGAVKRAYAAFMARGPAIDPTRFDESKLLGKPSDNTSSTGSVV